MPLAKLDAIIGQSFSAERHGCKFDVIPLPHPSGASPWHRMEPGKTLLQSALRLIARHPAFRALQVVDKVDEERRNDSPKLAGTNNP